MPDLQNNPEVLAFVGEFANLGFLSTLIFLIIGTVLTIIVQSSSATVAITLIMCSRGWIGFESAAAMIMGENIGTTITANLAAYSANISAKRAAFAHLMFNVLGVVWMLLIFKFFTNTVASLTENIWSTNPTGMTNFIASLSPEEFKLISTAPTSELSADLVTKQNLYHSYEATTSYGLSLFHTLFNIGNVLIMIWFVNVYERICKFVIQPKGEDEDEEFQLQFITTGMLSTAELSILQAEKEMEVYARRTRKMFKLVQKLAVAKDEVKFVKLFSRIEKYEGISDRMEIEIGSYLGKVAEGRLSNHSKERIRAILRGVTEIESIADSCHNMARHYKRKAEANSEFTEELRENIRTIWKELEKAYDKMQDVLKLQEVTEADITDSIKYENRINELRNLLKRKNIEDVNDKIYDYQTGVFYMDLVVECEHMGDYILNVVQSIQQQKV